MGEEKKRRGQLKIESRPWPEVREARLKAGMCVHSEKTYSPTTGYWSCKCGAIGKNPDSLWNFGEVVL